MRRRTALGAGSLLSCLVLAGCGFGGGANDVTLPGGADVGDHAYRVTVQFSDVLDLVPQAAVKVNDVAVGRVNKISLETANGKIADVVVELNGNVRLPANAVASIEETSLLGEKYVSLGEPLGIPAGRLRNGGTIGIGNTSDGAEVETVLGALSEVLTGGGVGQLHDITVALNTALHGHEPAARALLDSMTSIVTDLNTHKQSITQALDALATLATTLRSNNSQITNVLTSFTPGIAELARQRTQLITMLNSLNRLSAVTVDTLNQSQAQLIGDLRALAPVLSQLAAAGTALPESLQILVTYPFPNAAMQAIVGDYVNTFVTTKYRTRGGTSVTVRPQDFPVTTPRANGRAVAPPTITPPPTLLPPTSAAAPGLPSTLDSSPSSAPPSSSSSTPATSSSGATSPGSPSPTGSGTTTAPSTGGGH